MPDSRLARPLLALVAVAICLALPAPSRASIPYVPGEVVVRFREGTGEELRRAALGAVGGSQTHAVGTPRVQVVRISGVTIEQAVERLSANPGVVWAEPNYVIQPFVVPNDPRFPEQWPLRNVGQSGGLPDADIRATLAWDLTPGSSSVLVGVIDTGIDYKHPDLAPNIFVNPGEIPDNGIDDDENGFVDDVRGWDFLDRDNDPMDAQGHGTHVAGTIGASGNDSIGVAGVCWQVRLLPLRVLGPAGGTSAGAAEAVRYATMMGARVTNNSWGTSAVSNVLLDAITEARDAGVLFVAAAGNDSRDNAVFPVYPASYGLSNVLSVAATDRRDRLAAFSNYGATTVHIGAPGVDVLSTVPGGGYALSSGTSMACPHVTGALALLFARQPGITAEEVRARLLGGATPLASLANRLITGARLDAFVPIAPPDSIAPSEVLDLAVSRVGGEEVELAWTATGDDGRTGRATRYELRRSRSPIDATNFTGATPVETPPPQLTGSAERVTAGGLPFSTPWYFVLIARDERGNGSPLSNVVVATTLPPPVAQVTPAELSVALAGEEVAERTVTLSNTGASDLRFEVRAAFASAPDAPALAAEPPGLVRLPSGAVSFRLPGDPVETGPLAAEAPVASAPVAEIESGTQRMALHPEERARATLGSYVEGAPGPGPASVSRGRRTHAAGVDVLVLAMGTTAEHIAERIAEQPDVASVDVLDASIEVPPLSSLLPYDAVIVVSNEPPPDRGALGDVLADFVDQGGGLVLTLASFVRGFEITGRLTAGGYVPFGLAVGPVSGSTLGSYDVNHPIMRGVLSVSGQQLAATEPAADAQLVASWANGEPFVATRRGRVVGVNAYVGDPGAEYQGDVPRLLAQSAVWTRRGRWLSAEPKQGVVPAGGSVTLTVRFDAAGVVAGQHEAALEIHSNDPAQPLVAVAAQVDVTGTPDLGLAGETIRIGLERAFTVDHATSTFEFHPGVPPAGGIGFELVVEGDFGDPTERAVLNVEGSAIAGLGSTGVDCAAFAAIVPVDSTSFARWMEDGRIVATVQNSPDVNPFCSVNRHLLALRYPGPVDPLNFGVTLARGRRTVLLRVVNRGSAVLVLGSPEVDRPEFRVSAPADPIPPGGSVVIAVEFAPDVPGAVAGTLTIPSNDPDTPRRVVRLTGTCVTGPRMRVEPTTLELTLPEAAEGSRPLTIANDGESALHARIEVRPALPVTARGVRPTGDGRSRASIEDAPLPGVDEAVYQPLASSLTPITCVIEDAENGVVYGQEEGGRRFYRYRATSDTWEELAASPIAAHDNGGAALLHGRVYNVFPTVIDSIAVYDVASGTWTTRAAPVSSTAGITSDGVRNLYAMRGDALIRYDPETEETTRLTPPPFVVDPWCSIRWFEDKLYVHEATGRRRFVKYDVATDSWTVLQQLPAAAVLGAAIDPMAREYVTRGPAGGYNLYRYSIDRATWSTSALTAFTAEMSGMGWLPSPIPGICMAQGEQGTGFVRFVDMPEFLSPEVTDVTVPPHSARDVAITLRAGGLPVASYEAALAVIGDDPALAEVVVPVRMTVAGAPRLLVAGQAVTRVSSQTFESLAARTTHTFLLDPPAAAGATIRLEADGNFGVFDASASLSVEGRALGSVASFGFECDRGTATFAISTAEMNQMGVDGQLDAAVQNTFQVNPAACVLNRHRLTLTYVASARELVFGTVPVGEQARLIIDVANMGSAPLAVSSLTTNRPEFSVEALSGALRPGEHRAIEVRFTPAGDGPVEGAMTVASDDPSEPTRVVRLTGAGRLPPVLRVDEAPIQVHALERTAAVATLELGNDGAGPLAFQLAPRYLPAEPTTGEIRRRSSSPGPLTCTTADVPAHLLYAQQHGSTHFFRYLADEDRWENLPEAPFPALNDGGGALLNGRVYIAYADRSGQIAVYDIASRAWSVMEHPLGTTTAGIASDGRRYLYIGRNREVRRWDPVTGETWLLPPPPFTIENWGTLVWFDETLIVLRGNQTTDLAQFRAATGRWEVLAPVPGLPMLGAAVDPVARELVTTGGSTVYRLSLDTGAWTQTTLVGYAMKDGGHAWLPGPVPGVYLPQGETGPGLSVLVGHSPFVAVSPERGVVPPGQVVRVELRLGDESLPAGAHQAELRVLSDDPSRPTADVPLQLQLEPRPILALEGPAITETSHEVFQEVQALTVHRFHVSGPVSGPAALEVTVGGDFGDASEFAQVTIEGTVLGEVGGGGEDCQDVIGQFSIAPDLLTALMADGVVEVAVRNSPGVELTTCAENEHTVRLSVQAPLEPLDLGSVFLGDTSRRTLSIVNPGGQALSVALSTTGTAFSASPAAAVVPPHGRAQLEVRFAPLAEGEAHGTLVVRSDDPVNPERTMTLMGDCTTPPRVRVTPESLSVRLGPGLTLERPVVVRNVGGAELVWSARAGVPALPALPLMPLATELSLEEVLRRLDQRSAEITAPIPSLNDFSEGVTGHGITDGGLDMYDGGNELATNLTGPVPYSDGVVRVHTAFGGLGRYFTRKLPGLFVLAADLDGVTEFDVSGNLGADGSGLSSGLQVFATRGTVGYRGLCKRIYGTHQPSVNHMVIVQDQFGIAHTFPPANTGSDEHRITGLAGARRLYYLLYSSLDGGLVSDAATDSILNRLLDVVGAAPAWMTIGAESGSLPRGGEAAVSVVLDASSILPGDYHAEVNVDSNDPFARQRSVPVRLRVVDTPVAAPGADSLQFPDLTVGQAAELELSIASLGGQPLAIADASTDAADFTVSSSPGSLEPGEDGRVRVTFHPVAGGERRATLTVTSNDPERPSLLVALRGFAARLPALELRSESTSVTLNPGEVATRVLSVCQAGDGVLTYSVTTDSSAWLSVRGALNGTLRAGECAQDSLVLDAGGLSGGVYTAAIRVQSNDAAAPERVHRVTLEVRATEPQPSSLELAGAVPNPFSTSARLRYGLPRSAPVRLEVFDLAGRRRRVLLDGDQPAGWHEATWDGRDESGAIVQPGVFVLRLGAGGETRTQRIARLPARP